VVVVVVAVVMAEVVTGEEEVVVAMEAGKEEVRAVERVVGKAEVKEVAKGEVTGQ